MISRALLNAPFFIPKDADLLRNRKVNTKKRQNRHLPELAFLILGTYFTAPFRYKSDRRAQDVRGILKSLCKCISYTRYIINDASVDKNQHNLGEIKG